MAIQFSIPVRNARADAIESTIGTSPVFHLYSGSVPANCAAADPSGILCSLTLPADWESTASSGAKSLSGTWSGTASGTGTAASFRIKDSTDTTTGIQGTVTATGGGGDLTLDNTNISSGQTITITSFSITEGNA